MKQTITRITRLITAKLGEFVRWVVNHKKLTIPVAVVLLLCISGGGYALTAGDGDKDSSRQSQTTNASNVTSVYVDASIPGVTMSGIPYCDSVNLKKQTPYECILPEGEIETTITAPKEVSHEGATYVFQSWDGCSEGNEDWKKCKTITTKGGQTKIRASYNKTGQSTEQSSLGCPVQDRYIVTGPQAFTPGGSSRLVLYNASRDYQAPTFAQLWTGGLCKEIALSSELRATKAEGLATGFGMASSAYVTRSSERTDIPPGANAYIAVVDSGNQLRFIAVFRSDGTVVSDHDSIKKAFDPKGDLTSSESLWRFQGWIDGHTMLIRVPWNISGQTDCYKIDVDSYTYTATNPSFCNYY